ncbi:outer membrane receptor protein involved in Fe transport [Sphingobium subterraneum]|uniref:Outer membrane receptor protein involved in Fe transport n=1 Tax=Sphingobium subterraneum TaxID=627688 RepID=A0A841J0X0_9SPHN|nr:outer membrane receptor protein involved in Fe transport [Sphingobium subterraneum]
MSVYVDEVPLPFPALTSEASLDLERVEVLKGPQGILFGQNSTGGAINYIARKPTNSLAAGASITYGRFKDIEGTAFVSGPLTPTVSARLAVRAEQSDDWQYSYTRSDRIGGTKKIAGRLLLDWQASDRLKLEFNANGWIDRSDPQAGQLVGFSLSSGVALTPNGFRLLAYPLAPQNNRAADWSSDLRPKGNKRMGQLSLRGTYEVGGATITSITAYTAFRRRDVLDQDGLNLHSLDYPRADGDIRSFTQELRAAGDNSAPVRWLVGANYEHSTVNEIFQNYYPDSAVVDLLKGVAAGAGVDISFWNSNNFYSDQKLTNYAGFANFEFDATDKLTFKAGGRYTDSLRKIESCNSDDGTGGDAALFNFLYGLPRPGTPTIKIGQCVTSFQTPQGRVPVDVVRVRLHEDNFSWRVGVDFKPTTTTLLFANISKGYKAGSSPTAAAADIIQYKPVKQESVLAFEAGIKSRPFGRILDINASAFYYDYRNKQLRTLILDPVFGDLNNLTNVPKSTVKGVELSTTIRPVSGLALSGQVAYITTRVDKYIGYDPAITPRQNGNADFSGSRFPFTPKISASGTADYGWPLSDKLSASLGATVTYKSRATALIGGSAIDEIKPYTLLDLRAGIKSEVDGWRVQAWAKNVTNTYYWTNVTRSYDTILRYTGRPATYGITVGVEF